MRASVEAQGPHIQTSGRCKLSLYNRARMQIASWPVGCRGQIDIVIVGSTPNHTSIVQQFFFGPIFFLSKIVQQMDIGEANWAAEELAHVQPNGEMDHMAKKKETYLTV